LFTLANFSRGNKKLTATGFDIKYTCILQDRSMTATSGRKYAWQRR
jgi:hypothetical protein